MLERLDVLGMELSEMQGLKRGRVRVAMITTAKYFATRLIGDFCRAYPEAEFALEVVNREQILERMRLNLDDLYIMGQAPEGVDVVATPFADNPLVVSPRPTTRFATRRRSRRRASRASPSFCASRAQERGRRPSAISPNTGSVRRRG